MQDIYIMIRIFKQIPIVLSWEEKELQICHVYLSMRVWILEYFRKYWNDFLGIFNSTTPIQHWLKYQVRQWIDADATIFKHRICLCIPRSIPKNMQPLWSDLGCSPITWMDYKWKPQTNSIFNFRYTYIVLWSLILSSIFSSCLSFFLCFLVYFYAHLLLVQFM